MDRRYPRAELGKFMHHKGMGRFGCEDRRKHEQGPSGKMVMEIGGGDRRAAAENYHRKL